LALFHSAQYSARGSYRCIERVHRVVEKRGERSERRGRGVERIGEELSGEGRRGKER
jgi:hypothetical protein